ncbi:MAG: hypothetical protein JST00_17940 [Deltaproteobacteria bacterium]|nr:hypothetical protein [Deltaproteobacteria bacterium]
MKTTAASVFGLFGTALALLVVGCSAETTDPSSEGDDVEADESALSEEQRDVKRIEAIRKKVADVNQEKVTFSSRTKSPVRSAGSGSRTDTASLYGVDWFQKWPGGVSADHGWENGTEFGKRCMWAANLRFEAIMKEPPEELKAFRGEYTRWSGNFYNWVDDYSKPESYGDASGARLWAWRTGLSKWISQAAKDGSCFLPTKQMVADYVKACKEHQARNDGEMQGCQSP